MLGLDYIGAAKFTDTILSAHPKGAAVGCINNIFGDALPCMRELLRTGKTNTVRIHSIWDDQHVFRPRIHLPIIQADIKKINKLKRDFQSANIYYSPFCEHNIKGREIVELKEFCKSKLKDVSFVNSVYQGDLIKGEINEIHKGTKKGKGIGEYIFSYDGHDALGENIQKDFAANRDALIFFLWAPQFNGRKSADDSTPRPQRRAWADKQLIKYIWDYTTKVLS